jgi:hypothetical protein
MPLRKRRMDRLRADVPDVHDAIVARRPEKVLPCNMQHAFTTSSPQPSL